MGKGVLGGAGQVEAAAQLLVEAAAARGLRGGEDAAVGDAAERAARIEKNHHASITIIITIIVIIIIIITIITIIITTIIAIIITIIITIIIIITRFLAQTKPVMPGQFCRSCYTRLRINGQVPAGPGLCGTCGGHGVALPPYLSESLGPGRRSFFIPSKVGAASALL